MPSSVTERMARVRGSRRVSSIAITRATATVNRQNDMSSGVSAPGGMAAGRP